MRTANALDSKCGRTGSSRAYQSAIGGSVLRQPLTATQARVTVASWLIEWLAGLKATAGKGGIALSTYRCYRSYAKNHLIPKLGRKKLVQLTTKDVRDMMASRLGQERPAVRETGDGRSVKQADVKAALPT